MSVRNGFTIEIYRFMHSLRTFWHVRMPSRDGMEIEVDIEDDARTSPDVLVRKKTDERRQDNGIKK